MGKYVGVLFLLCVFVFLLFSSSCCVYNYALELSVCTYTSKLNLDVIRPSFSVAACVCRHHSPLSDVGSLLSSSFFFFHWPPPPPPYHQTSKRGQRDNTKRDETKPEKTTRQEAGLHWTVKGESESVQMEDAFACFDDSDEDAADTLQDECIFVEGCKIFNI